MIDILQEAEDFLFSDPRERTARRVDSMRRWLAENRERYLAEKKLMSTEWESVLDSCHVGLITLQAYLPAQHDAACASWSVGRARTLLERALEPWRFIRAYEDVAEKIAKIDESQ